MRLNFLCAHHRRSLMASPEAAREVWGDSLTRLEELEPVPSPYRVNLIGSALEAAGIYLMAEPGCDPQDIDRYVQTALALIELLGELSQHRLVVVVVAGVNATLEHLARQGADREATGRGCRRLTMAGMQHVDGPLTRGGPLQRRSRRTPAPQVAVPLGVTVH